VTRIIVDVDPARVGQSADDDDFSVLLYAPSTTVPGACVIGNDLREKFERLSIPPTPLAVDLVSIAMAVTAADTFVLREDEADGWRRTLEIELPVNDPAVWNAISEELAATLGFLSGDTWSFSFRTGGLRPPSRRDVRARTKSIDPSRSDCVALFSGGLDSALGVAQLIDQGSRPLLVSHAGHGDKSYQSAVAGLLPQPMQRFEFNSYPRSPFVTEISSRTRSFQFLAVGVLVAEALSQFRSGSAIDLNMCENGLIALNPPLTQRRIGALSTRTAHPHYLAGVQGLLGRLGMPVRIVNPHRHETKGEMLARRSASANIANFASTTVSCGNWKRKGAQCGRCWPCSIRRAAFVRAGVTDHTPYLASDLIQALREEAIRDDVVSIHTALRHRYERNLKAWVMQSGPLPLDPNERSACFEVVERGMDELEQYFAVQGLKV
jgi:hypothetical protein